MSRYLLDTHAFLWWITDDKRLSTKARALIANKEHEILFSVVSAWEIAIKTRLGRLKEVGDPAQTIPHEIQKNRFEVLAISLDTALAEYALPDLHPDPFDRLLISQALTERVPLVSCDKAMRGYNVSLLW